MDVPTARWPKDLRRKFKKERKKLRRVRASKTKIQKSIGTLEHGKGKIVRFNPGPI